MKRVTLGAAVMLALVGSTGFLQAQQWGDLKVQFVYDGEPPTATPLKATTDTAFCGQFHLLDESLVINSQNKGIANVVVFLYVDAQGGSRPPVHPDYEATATSEVSLDNLKCRFDPHVTLLRTTQTLLVMNTDDIGHNTKVDTFNNPAINPILPAHGNLKHQFKLEERLPARVSCSIHPWMTGWVVIKELPYFARSDANGALEIKNLPVGKWTFQFWQEKAGYLTGVGSKGRKEIAINPGVNDLGTIKLAPAEFEK